MVDAKNVIREPQQARSKQKKQMLLEAGTEEFSEKEYEDVTAKTIAQRAGVATGTLYQYFENKDAVLREIARERLAVFTETIVSETGEPMPDMPELSIGEYIRQSIELTYRYHTNRPRLQKTIEYRRSLDPELDKMQGIGDRKILERVAKTLATWGIKNKQQTAFVIVAMAEGLVHRLVYGGFTVSPTKSMAAGADSITTYIQSLIS